MAVFLRIHYKWARFERYWSSLKGLSTDLECVIFKRKASCSFWNKADYESIKQGNLITSWWYLSQSVEYIRIKAFFFISPCTEWFYIQSLGPLKDIESGILKDSHKILIHIALLAFNSQKLSLEIQKSLAKPGLKILEGREGQAFWPNSVTV